MSTNDRFGREAPWNFGEFLSKVALGAMLWAIASGGVPGVGSARTPPATAGAQPSVSYLDIFDEIWTTIQNEYYDPAFNGVDWRSARLRYRPRVESAKSPSEAFGYIETLLRIALPLSLPGIVTVMIFNVTTWWNDLLIPLVFIGKEEKTTLTAAAATVGSRFSMDFPLVLCSLFLASVPPILAYIVLQRYIRRGLVLGAVK